MGVFDDKKFEELDWISQAMEPIDSKLNDYLNAIPEEVEIDFDTYIQVIGDSYGMSISVESIVLSLLRKSPLGMSGLTWTERETLSKCFTLEMDSALEVFLDFEKKEIYGGTIRLIKSRSTMDEKDLEGLLGQEGVSSLSSNWRVGPAGLSRANEIMELLGGCEEGLKTKSNRLKRAALCKRIRALFKSNEWKIKDTELANKVSYWISDYINNGNLAALSNFCRLKVMTHKGQPIYSMEEVV